MIEIKSETELALIEKAGRIVNKVIDEIKKIAGQGRRRSSWTQGPKR